MGDVGKLVRIMTMHHRVATTGQILDMVGPYRVSEEPTVLNFVCFHLRRFYRSETAPVSPHMIRTFFLSPVRDLALRACAPT